MKIFFFPVLLRYNWHITFYEFRAYNVMPMHNYKIITTIYLVKIYNLTSAVQLLGCVPLFVTPWTAAHQPPCLSPTPRACWNSCPLSWWCHPTISSSVTPFSSCFQSFPASGSFPRSQFFASGGQRIGASASASVPPLNIQDWITSHC